MIDDDTLKQLLRSNGELFHLCKWLNEGQDTEISSRLIPLVDQLTHILIDAGKNRLQRTGLRHVQPRKSVIRVPGNQGAVESV